RGRPVRGPGPLPRATPPHRPAAVVHLFLVGPPGIGKSSVAPALARHFGAAVVELDREIERRARKSCKDVIEQDGMDRFRELESSALMRCGWGRRGEGDSTSRAIVPVAC